jgi:hypothetical protein
VQDVCNDQENVMPNAKPVPPQEWELSALLQSPATKLVAGKQDTLGQFFLSLAVAFNDLKGLIMFQQYLTAMRRPPNDSPPSPHVGQWHGTAAQLERYIIGVLHETMNVIAVKRFADLRNGAEMKAIVSSIGTKNRAAWDTLVAVATEAPTHSKWSPLLRSIRNAASFHYNHKSNEFIEAYLSWFDPAKAANEAKRAAAMYSLGVDMDGTRFYYADAAAQQAMAKLLADQGATVDDVSKLALAMNNALAAMLRRFILNRTG